MKRIISATLLMSVAACSAGGDGDEAELLGDSQTALNGDLSAEGFLKIKTVSSPNALNEPNELERRADTDDYYDWTSTSDVGKDVDKDNPSIRAEIGTLQDFKDRYGFSSEFRTRYYNRGDLGLGRDMHCAGTSSSEYACYVTNYAAGPDGSEFSFGFSRDIAFSNMHADPPKDVATVAMVWRSGAPANKKVIFAVYDDNEVLTNTAPLDRHGLNFFNAFKDNGNVDPGTAGTPGVEFNNHIPSNCLNCHGGTYTPRVSPTVPPNVSGAYFLPFDLDQFDFQDVAGQTRFEQLTQFWAQNQLVRTVAVDVSGSSTHPIVTQINGWYARGGVDFDSNYVPPGWNTDADRAVYQQVVRPSCRSCHIASQRFRFDGVAEFPIAEASELLASHSMPHALQTQRLFWQSGQPITLEAWFRAKEETGAAETGAADLLRNAGPGSIVTLDPHLLTVAVQ